MNTHTTGSPCRQWGRQSWLSSSLWTCFLCVQTSNPKSISWIDSRVKQSSRVCLINQFRGNVILTIVQMILIIYWALGFSILVSRSYSFQPHPERATTMVAYEPKARLIESRGVCYDYIAGHWWRLAETSETHAEAFLKERECSTCASVGSLA